MLNKSTISSGLAALALAGGIVAQSSAPAAAQYYHPRYYHPYYHHHDDAGVAIGAGVLGLALGATLGGALAPRTVYYDSGYYAPPPVYYAPGPVYLEGPAYPPPPRVRVYETSSGHVARCEMRYRTYDPGTDTFMGYDGRPHYCRL